MIPTFCRRVGRNRESQNQMRGFALFAPPFRPNAALSAAVVALVEEPSPARGVGPGRRED